MDDGFTIGQYRSAALGLCQCHLCLRGSCVYGWLLLCGARDGSICAVVIGADGAAGATCCSGRTRYAQAVTDDRNFCR